MSKKETPHILAGLDSSATDDYIISFLDQNAAAFGAQKIDFIHILKEGKAENADESIKERLFNSVHNAFTRNDIKYELHFSVGDPAEEVRNRSKNTAVNLLVLGHKKSEEHQLETNKLVKKPVCSLLLVPKKKDYSISKICVALDFSELSLHTLKHAVNIAELTGAKVVGFHAYEVPTGYHKSGKDHREYAEVMEENANKKAEVFLDKAGIENIDIAYAYDEGGEPANCIAQFARNSNSDLVLIGSKGRTSAASILLGSVAKELIETLYDIPLMVVKVKNENMDFVDAIKKI